MAVITKLESVMLQKGIMLPGKFGTTSKLSHQQFKLELNIKDRLVRVDGKVLLPFENIAYLVISKEDE